jgi:hypothetical protein
MRREAHRGDHRGAVKFGGAGLGTVQLPFCAQGKRELGI